MKVNSQDSSFTQLQKFVFISLFFIILTFALRIHPFGDDWGYLTEPSFPYDKLTVLQNGKWRPIDRLLGLLLGYFPSIYPYINHILIVTAHFASGYFLFRIVLLKGFSKTSSFLSAILFLVAGNAFSTTFSIDSLNQALSLTFGVVSIFYYVTATKNKYIFYLIFSFLSITAKESGFLFFIIPPIFDLIIKKSKLSELTLIFRNKEYIGLLTGLIFTVFYLALLLGPNLLNGIHEYNTQLDIKSKPDIYNPIFGTLAIIGRILPINCPALILGDFTNKMVAIFCITISLPFFILLFIDSLNRIFKKDIFTISIISIILMFALSHSFVNAITEMNSYPAIFFASLLFPQFIDYLFSIKKKTHIPIIIICSLFLSSLIVNLDKLHKCSTINKNGNLIASNISRQTSHQPQNVYVLIVDVQSLGHDIYQFSPAFSSGCGDIMKLKWKDWKLRLVKDTYCVYAKREELVWKGNQIFLDKKNYRTQIKNIIVRKIKNYDAVWVVYNNGDVQVYEKNKVQA